MTQENTGTEDAFDLDALCALAERLQQHQSAPGQQQAAPVEATDVVLAAFLARNLRQGGFAQLIFNAQGQYLGEMAKMLQNMNASNTLHFYEQAVRVCLADKAGYQSFLSSDYVGALAVKNPLHEVSMDYYESSPQFAQEAWPSLSKACVTATQWLNENQPEPQA